MNLTGLIFLALDIGNSVEKIQQSVINFKMVKRRQEVKGMIGESLVVDDFAHHPTAVRSTLELFKQKYPDKKLIVALQPASATARSSLFQREFPLSLEIADELVLLKTKVNTTVKDSANLDFDLVAKDWGAVRKKSGHVVSNLEDLSSCLSSLSSSDSVIIVMNNSTCFGLWESDYLSPI